MDALELIAKIKMDLDDYEKGLDTAESKAKSFGSKLSSGLGTAAKVGAAAVAAVGTAAAVAGKSLVNNAKEVAAYGDNIDKMSQKIGISAEAYQEWDAVFQHSGANVNSLQQGMKALNNQLNKVKTAADLAKSPFAQLGLSLDEVNAAAKDPDKALEMVISHLQELPAGAERSALATQLLGRSGVELGALLNQTAEDTQKMRDRVHELGGVMSDEAVKASAQFQDNMQDLHTALDGVKRNLVSETLPAFNDLIDGFTKLIAGEEGAETAIDNGINKLSGAIDKIIPRVGDLLEKLLPRVIEIGGKLITAFAQQLPKIITSVAKQIPTLIKEILKAAKATIPQIIKAGTELIQELANGMGNGEESILDMIFEIIDALVNAISENLPAIIDAGMMILEKLIDGIIDNLPKIADAVFQIIEKIGLTIIEKLPEIVEKGAEIIEKLVKGLIDNLPKIIQAAVEIIKKLAKALIDNLPEILQAGVQLILELAKGIFEALPDLLAQIPQIIIDLVSALLDPDNIAKILDAGFQMIGSLFEGLFSGDFLGTAGDIIEALLGAVLAIPGMIMDIGAKIVGFIFEGIKDAWNGVVDWVETGIEALLGDVNAARDQALGELAAVDAKYQEKIAQNRRNYELYGSAYGITGQESFAGSNSQAAIAQSQSTSRKSGSSNANNFAGASSQIAIYNTVNIGNKTVAKTVSDGQRTQNNDSGGRSK